MLKVDDPRVMDSTGALDLPDIPKSLLVVGGGYIGLELGIGLRRARQRRDRRRDDAGPAARRRSRSRGRPGASGSRRRWRSVLLETQVVQMKPERAGHSRHLRRRGQRRRSQVFDRVLVAVGRRPNSRIPGLDRTRVQVDDRGFIVVDEQRRTARAVDLRDRRRRRRADAGAQGVARRARRGRGDCRRERRVRAARDSGRRLHRSGTGLGGLTERRPQKDNRHGDDRRSFRGARRAARSRSIAPTA